jgi:hypothetical protein
LLLLFSKRDIIFDYNLLGGKILNIPIVQKMTSSAILLEIIEYIYTDNINQSELSHYSLFDLYNKATYFMLDHLKEIIEDKLVTMVKICSHIAIYDL